MWPTEEERTASIRAAEAMDVRAWTLIILIYIQVMDGSAPRAKRVQVQKCSYPVSGAYTLNDCANRADAELRTFLAENQHIGDAIVTWHTISEA